jgi:hypothetical protein
VPAIGMHPPSDFHAGSQTEPYSRPATSNTHSASFYLYAVTHMNIPHIIFSTQRHDR